MLLVARQPDDVSIPGDLGSPGFQEIYDAIHAIAVVHMRRERSDHTLQATALVHEVYLRMSKSPGGFPGDQARFLRAASKVIRNLLVDHARAKRADKRGGRGRRLELDPQTPAPAVRNVIDLVALDDALQHLSELHERQAKIVELRFFGGLGVEEAASVVGVSPRTVESDWKAARAWLHHQLGGEGA